MIHPPDMQAIRDIIYPNTSLRRKTMFGTVARLRVKPGAVKQLIEMSQEESSLNIPGYIAQYVYRTDNDPNEYYLVVLFESREAYFANADSPEQDARYRKFRSYLEADPEWHDGDVVFADAAR
jgi:heme-degrading monooxygenase HmoA